MGNIKGNGILALFTALFGMMLLRYALGLAQTHLTYPSSPIASAQIGPAIILGSIVCAALSLASSCLIYRHHRWSVIAYCASWALNTIGTVALGLIARQKPPWLVLLYSACFAWAGYAMLIGARKGSTASLGMIVNPATSSQAPRFTWGRYAIFVATMFVIHGFFINLLWKEHMTSAALAMAILALSLVGYFGYRFFRLRAALESGTFIVEEYLRDPSKYTFGPTRPLVVWFTCTVLAFVGVIVFV